MSWLIAKWWMAVGGLIISAVMLHPLTYNLGNLDDAPDLKKLPRWALILLYWLVAMVTIAVWPLFVWRWMRRMGK